VAEVRGAEPDGQVRLGRREREVLRLIAEGERSVAIAEALHISAATVEVHRRNIMRKLGLHTVAELTRYAVREGIVQP
jgi:two-component system NarL family response regulator